MEVIELDKNMKMTSCTKKFDFKIVLMLPKSESDEIAKKKSQAMINYNRSGLS